MKQKQTRKTAGPNLHPVTRTTISDEIVAQIMGLIESGELKPGQRLPSERELSVRFGTGRSSLREALRCLSIVGVLRARVGDGTTVANGSAKFLGKLLQWRMITERHDVENLMEVRMALEGFIVAKVAADRTAEDLATLKSLLTKMKTSLDDSDSFLNLDVEFHLELARASRNTLALDLITMVRGQLSKALALMLTTPNGRPLTLKEHQGIVRMIEKQDVAGARTAISAHLQASAKRYFDTVDKMPSKTVTVSERPRGASKPPKQRRKTSPV
jgi:GntR family transcriptional repressor for pyruvate dehydrogenase complex